MKFICECNKEFDNIESYTAHRYRCSVGKTFFEAEKNKYDYLNNLIFSKTNNLYVCNCGTSCKTKKRYSYHINNCEKFAFKKELNEIKKLKEKNSDNIYKCNDCDKVFRTLRGLSLHCSKNNHSHNYKIKYDKTKRCKKIYKCHICNYEAKTYKELCEHYEKTHDYKFTNLLDFKVKYNNFLKSNTDIPKCKYCKTEYINCKSGRIVDNCGSKICKYFSASNVQKNIHKNNPQLAINARERRIKYLSNKNNFYNTAWGNKNLNKLSFLEQWFLENVINKYNLNNKFNIVNEFPITNEDKTSAYSLDFAFTNIKLDVELDGRCHFNNGIDRINHDIKRDEFLKSLGWNVYRISYKDVEKSSIDTINNFMNYINKI